jgi:hypothetical protein
MLFAWAQIDRNCDALESPGVVVIEKGAGEVWVVSAMDGGVDAPAVQNRWRRHAMWITNRRENV